jgi:uncharacterized protein YsxB (DUF464 family)
MFNICSAVILLILMIILGIAYQNAQASLQLNRFLVNKVEPQDYNETSNDTEVVIKDLKKSMTALAESAPRQVVLSIVSFFVAMAFTIFGIQLAFRPQKAEIKYFTAAILSLIIPVTVLLVTFVGSNVLGIQTFGLISQNVWLFASLMLLIPIFTLIILVILHRISRERSVSGKV